MRTYQDLASFSLPSSFRGRPAPIVQLWWLIQSLLFHTSPQFMYGWRRFLLRLFGARIGKGVLIRPSVRTTYPWNVSIGDRSWIGDDVVLYSLGEIRIESDVVISQRSYLCTGSHDFEKASFDILAEPIVVEEQAWVASDVFIAPGSTIGSGAVIGARSTVLQDMPPGMICVGTPAKPTRARKASEEPRCGS